MDQLGTHYENDPDRYIEELERRWTELLSTFHGESSANAVQHAWLTPDDLDLIRNFEYNFDELDDEIDTEPPPLPAGDLLIVANKLLQIDELNLAEVEFLPLWGKLFEDEWFAMYRLPKKIKKVAYPWCYRKKTARTRMALAAKVVKKDPASDFRTLAHYVLDFEPNPDNSSIVIVWRQDGNELSNGDLCSLVTAFAQARSVSNLPEIFGLLERGLKLTVGHRKHMAKIREKTPAEFLALIFDTIPKYSSELQSDSGETRA